jgi:uncharacterized membrane protein YbhN (UPF0104 family)
MNDASELDTDVGAAAVAASQPPSQQRGYGAFALRAGLGLAVIAVILHHYDLTQTFALIRRERPSFFIAAIAVYVAGQAMSAWRWQLLARVAEIPGRYREYLTFYFIGMFTNVFVPGLIGGDAARAIYLGRRYDRMSQAVASVVADRGIGFVAMLWYAAGCAILVSGVPLPANATRAIIAVGIAGVAGYLAAPLIARLSSRMPRRIERMVRPVLLYLRQPWSMIPAIVLSLLLQASLAVVQYLIAVGLGFTISLATIMLLLPLANALASLPLTLNGLGVRDAAFLVLFGMAGVGRSDALAMSLLFFVATLIGGLTGMFPFVTTGMPREANAASLATAHDL